jgi:prolyl-tRNA synthetase
VRYLLDPRVVDGSAWVTGADSPGRHVIGLVAGRDFHADGSIDVAEVRNGDPCPDCGAALTLRQGIEIGHIFQLGTKYARALGLEVAGPDGKSVVVTMGSYGIGVSRAVAAIAEATLDEKGLCWPREVAPADVHLLTAGKEPAVVEYTDRLATALAENGVRVLYDDRMEMSAGVKFKDAELIGVPTVVVVGKGLAEGIVEVRNRRTGAVERVPTRAVADHLAKEVKP